MKKTGYTLAEALITIGIIGAIAGITLPLVNKFKPDTSKIMFLKAYDAVVQLTRSIADNTDIYSETWEGADGYSYTDSSGTLQTTSLDYTLIPLYNLSQYQDNTTERVHSGISKFCTLLADGFNAWENGVCRNHPATFNNAQMRALNINNVLQSPDFTTPSGMDFVVRTITNNAQVPGAFPANAGNYQTTIFVDINGRANEPNCTYNANDCTHPDRFMIYITAHGRVVTWPTSGIEQYYLDTRTNFKNVDNKIQQNGGNNPVTNSPLLAQVIPGFNNTANTIENREFRFSQHLQND